MELAGKELTMPLLKGKRNIGRNITELKEHGSHPRSMKQIEAIALSVALGKQKKSKKK